MGNPGFGLDYEGMGRATEFVHLASGILRDEQGDFAERASLDRAVPEFGAGGGDPIPVLQPTPTGGDLDEASNLIANTIRGPYADAVAAVAEFTYQMRVQLGFVAFHMTASRHHYERVDAEELMSALGAALQAVDRLDFDGVDAEPVGNSSPRRRAAEDDGWDSGGYLRRP